MKDWLDEKKLAVCAIVLFIIALALIWILNVFLYPFLKVFNIRSAIDFKSFRELSNLRTTINLGYVISSVIAIICVCIFVFLVTYNPVLMMDDENNKRWLCWLIAVLSPIAFLFLSIFVCIIFSSWELFIFHLQRLGGTAFLFIGAQCAWLKYRIDICDKNN